MAGSNIQNVSFQAALDPQAAANLQLQAQQAQQNLAMAQALRERSMTPESVPAGSRMSWTQGLAQVAQAWAAKSLMNKGNLQTRDAAVKQGQLLQQMYGLQPQPSSQAVKIGAALPGASPTQQPAPQPAPQSPPPAQQAPQPASQPAQIPNPVYGSGGVDDDGNQSPNVPALRTDRPTDQMSNIPQPQPQPSPQVPAGPAPQGTAQQPPQAPQMQPSPQAPALQQGDTPFPDLPGENHMASMYQAFNSPDTYYSALNAAHANTDFQKLYSAYTAAVQSGDTQAAATYKGQLDKQSAIEQREGGTAIINGQRFFNPKIDAGYTPTYDDKGNVNGETPLNGHLAAVASAASAQAAGQKGGENTGTLTTTYDAQGNPHYNTTAQVVGAAQGGAPMNAGPPIGAKAGADADAQAGVKLFGDDAAQAGDVPSQRAQIGRIRNLVSGMNTGVGATTLNHLKSGANFLSRASGHGDLFDQNNISNVDAFLKESADMSNREASMAGGTRGSSDARLASAKAALADPEKSQGAINEILNVRDTRTSMIQGKSQAAQSWAQQNGTSQSSHNAFTNAWNANADFDMFDRLRAAGGNPAVFLHGLTPAQGRAWAPKYAWLLQHGGIPQSGGGR